MTSGGRDPLPYIDAVRGYAILLVITCHVTYAYPELPYPVHRLTALGWHGVQLFFLASAVTLMMSWNAERARAGRVDMRAFLLRRFFRIAPAYYAAGLLYAWLMPPAGAYDAWQALAVAAFATGWHPWMMAVSPGTWNVVPGSWSIGVEFTFYLLFPLFAALAGTLGRALLLLGASVVVAVLANATWGAWMASSLPPMERANFLYFWFPDQAPVFAAGGVLYHLLGREGGGWARFARGWPTLAPAVAAGGFFAIAYVPLGHAMGTAAPFVGAFLVACLPFGAFVLALAHGRGWLFVNPAIRALGKVSFSAYLLHYGVIHVLLEGMPALFGVGRTGVAAIAAFAGGLAVVVLVTYAGARATWWLIEEPGIALGKRLVRRLPARAG